MIIRSMIPLMFLTTTVLATDKDTDDKELGFLGSWLKALTLSSPKEKPPTSLSTHPSEPMIAHPPPPLKPQKTDYLAE